MTCVTPVDVQAAGRNVGGDQYVDLAGPERPQGPFAGALAEVAVHGGRGEAAEVEILGDPVGGALGPREDHRQAAAVRTAGSRATISILFIGCVR